ncbi:glucan endo-1,3-beta-glucosidase [Silene latifolia]|uniref:glucan endo-1,3-beta-glucosidase n=1 Tax=Silene latifolia TaxID=37657 RepID=UPI003D77CDB6
MAGIEAMIGVNYGMMADNLPPPENVANFLADSTIINRVRLFDANPYMLQAFAHTKLAITITIPNLLIPQFTNLTFAQEWINTNISTHIRFTNIIRILVGNEVLSTGNKLLITYLVPAMQTLHRALLAAALDRKIQISTPHSLGVLSSSSPPSSGIFRQGYDEHVFRPLLKFLRDTGSPFIINPYPFFDTSNETLNYALFMPNHGVFDYNTNVNYTNMLDAQLDSVFCAMKRLGFDDVDIVIGETGWPSQGDPLQVGVDPQCAAVYNANLVRHVTSGVGTPLMLNRTFETYVFALFDEDLKFGPTFERHFGLFGPNLTPKYNVGLLKPSLGVIVCPTITAWYWLVAGLLCVNLMAL